MTAPVLNKIEKINDNGVMRYRVIMSEDIVRLASKSVFGPIHETALFSIQAIVVDALKTGDASVETSDVLAWIITPKFNNVRRGDTFITVTRRSFGAAERMQALDVAGRDGQAEAVASAALKLAKALKTDAPPVVAARFEGLMAIEIGDQAGLLIAIQPDNMSI